MLVCTHAYIIHFGNMEIDMTMELDILKERLRETFGNDSQEIVGGKLNMTQGNVSKLLSGTQQPTLDTLYRIAEVYDVSVDWLTGLSKNKKRAIVKEKDSYAAAVEMLMQLYRNGCDIDFKSSGYELKIDIKDPILKALIKKSITLSKTDKELYQSWKEMKLNLFNDKHLVYQSIWQDEDVNFLAGEATAEAHWIEVYNLAKDKEEEYAEMMGDDPGPFGG